MLLIHSEGFFHDILRLRAWFIHTNTTYNKGKLPKLSSHNFVSQGVESGRNGRKKPRLSEDGMMRGGVIVRHLVLPGQLEAAKEVMDWVSEQFRPGEVLFSLMSQYIPCGHAADFAEIDRPLRRGEARKAEEYMALLGLEGFTQEQTSASEQFIPPFDLTGVEKC